MDEKDILRTHMRDWQLQSDGPLQETFSSLIQPVRYLNSQAMLKCFKPHSDEKNSAAILRKYNGKGAVRVLNDSLHALLLERAIPGHRLTETVLEGRDNDATAIFCDVVQALHGAIIDADSCPAIDSLFSVYARYTASNDSTVPANALDTAQQLFRQLIETSSSPVLLHGDLHHGNILYDANRGWLAIDPKGYIGEAEAEVAMFLKNPEHPRYYADPSIIQRRLDIITKRLPLSHERILHWTYCLYVISLIWHIEDGTYEVEYLLMLDVLETLI